MYRRVDGKERQHSSTASKDSDDPPPIDLAAEDGEKGSEHRSVVAPLSFHLSLTLVALTILSPSIQKQLSFPYSPIPCFMCDNDDPMNFASSAPSARSQRWTRCRREAASLRP